MNKFHIFLFVFISFVSLNCFAQNKEETIKNISAKEFNDLISIPSDTSVILDVRTSDEFESGHLDNAVNINFYNEDFKSSLSKLDKSKTYFVYCKSSGRSSKACNMLSEFGFEKIYNLTGGIDAWKAAGLSTVK